LHKPGKCCARKGACARKGTTVPYLLSLAEAVGARRFRQATREFVKAYAAGVTAEEFDGLFSLFTWNKGVAHLLLKSGRALYSAHINLLKIKKRKVKRAAQL